MTGWITLLMMVCSGPFLFTGFAQYLMQFLSSAGIAHITSSAGQFSLEIACLVVVTAIALLDIRVRLNAYVQVLGFDGISANLASQSSPLSTLASHYHVSWLGDVILIGVTISFFAAANATLNYGPRVLFTMAHDGLLPLRAANTNRRGAPYRAIWCYAIAWLAVLTYVLVSGVAQGTAFGNLGSLAGYCGTLIYMLASLATPIEASPAKS